MDKKLIKQQDRLNINSFKKGDLLFTNTVNDSIGKAISEVGSVYRYPVNHIAIFIDKGRILQSISQKGVSYISLEDYLKEHLKDNKIKISVASLFYKEYIDNFIKESIKYLGYPYNNDFNSKGESFYCSEIILQALKDCKYPEILEISPMTFKNKEGNFIETFINLYKGEENIPEGTLGSHPAKLFLDLKLEIKYDYLKTRNQEGFKIYI